MITDFSVDSYIAHDFDELYELLRNAEPEFQRKNMWYEILQCGDEENGDKCFITAVDLTKSYKKPGPNDDFYSPEFYEDKDGSSDRRCCLYECFRYLWLSQ